MGGSDSLHAVETVILLLLVLVAVFAVVARRLKVPYPIVLVVAGLVISFFPRMPKIPLEPNIGVCDFSAAVAVCVGMVDVVARVSAECGGDWAAGGGAGGLYGVGGGGVFGPVYYGAGLEGGISAGGGGLDDGCDCGDVDCEVDWAAEEDRRHSGGREPAE